MSNRRINWFCSTILALGMALGMALGTVCAVDASETAGGTEESRNMPRHSS